MLGPLAACGLESGGLGPSDGGLKETSLEDRGIGMTDSGQACICVPNPGTGKVVAYERDGADPCPSDYAMQKFAVEENQTGPATCACTCGNPTANSTCVIAGVSLRVFKNGNCSGSPDSTLSLNNFPCYDVIPDYNPSGTLSAKGTAQITPQGGMCGAGNLTSTIPSDLHKGQACTLTAAMGSGCANAGDVCVPKATAPFGLCVAIPMADATCPTGFPTKHKVGTGKMDSRACTACTCTPNPTCLAGSTFNDENDCTGNNQGMTVNLDNNCHPITNNDMSGKSVITKIVNVTQQCSPSGAMPTGSVSLDSEYTICCPLN